MYSPGDTVVKTRIIRIGNSRGVRIPKPLLDQAGLGEEVEVRAEDDAIVIRPRSSPRQGWAQAFQRMHERGDDAMTDALPHGPTSWDEDEWQW